MSTFCLHLRNAFRRIFFEYYLRDFTLGSIALPVGLFLLTFGFIFGLHTWITNIAYNVITPAGTVMFSVLPIILGFQLILTFLYQDMISVPQKVITPRIRKISNKRK